MTTHTSVKPVTDMLVTILNGLSDKDLRLMSIERVPCEQVNGSSPPFLFKVNMPVGKLSFPKGCWGREDALGVFNYSTQEFLSAMMIFMTGVACDAPSEWWLRDENYQNGLFSSWYKVLIHGTEPESEKMPEVLWRQSREFLQECYEITGMSLDEDPFASAKKPAEVHDVFLTALLQLWQKMGAKS